MIPYVATRLYKKERVFNTFEWFVVALVIIGAVAAVLLPLKSASPQRSGRGSLLRACRAC